MYNHSPLNNELDDKAEVAPRILSVEEMHTLPSGICLISSNHLESGTAALGRLILAHIRKDSISANPRCPSIFSDRAFRLSAQPERLVGPFFTNCQDGFIREVADRILNSHPNLCFLRGTSYHEDSMGFPSLSMYALNSGNGLVGDSNALNFVTSDYEGKPNGNPVLHLIKMSDVLRASDSRVLRIGTEHEYDITLTPRDARFGANTNAEFGRWLLEHDVICDLGNSDNDIANARKILESKSLEITSALN